MKIKDIEKLVKILENSIITEIEITDFWGRKIKINKSDNRAREIVQPQSENVVVKEGTRVVERQIQDEKKVERKNLVAIRSPIVGTFYRSPAPDAPPYVEIGDIIKPGQVVCIVEAMKLMNEIESDVAGRIMEILVKNEEPVEYNQELFSIEPL